jgi:hypothetical protein
LRYFSFLKLLSSAFLMMRNIYLIYLKCFWRTVEFFFESDSFGMKFKLFLVCTSLYLFSYEKEYCKDNIYQYWKYWSSKSHFSLTVEDMHSLAKISMKEIDCFSHFQSEYFPFEWDKCSFQWILQLLSWSFECRNKRMWFIRILNEPMRNISKRMFSNLKKIMFNGWFEREKFRSSGRRLWMNKEVRTLLFGSWIWLFSFYSILKSDSYLKRSNFLERGLCSSPAEELNSSSLWSKNTHNLN